MKKSILLLTLVLLIVLLVLSCKSKENNTLENKHQLTQHTFSKLLQGGHSNVYENKQLVIRSEEELLSIYKEINNSRTPNLEIPKIDFKKEVVLALFMGAKSSGGYSIAINKITETNDDVVVYYKENAPSGMATAVMSQPFYIASMPITTKSIRFVKE